jgi:LPS export ABC transporter protein LptC
MKVRRLGIGFSVFVIFALVLFNACSSSENESASEKKMVKEHPDQEGWNSEIILSKQGKKQAVVNYGHMVHYDRGRIYYFDEGVAIDLYNESEEHTSRLTSLRGEYHERSEDVIGMGNVVVRSDSGVTLHTEILRWDNRKGKIISDTTVMVTTEVSLVNSASATVRPITHSPASSGARIEFAVRIYVSFPPKEYSGQDITDQS